MTLYLTLLIISLALGLLLTLWIMWRSAKKLATKEERSLQEKRKEKVKAT